MNTQIKELAQVKRVKMTDGSVAYNVVATIDGQYRKAVFACETAEDADDLAHSINKCSWVEVIENGKV